MSIVVYMIEDVRDLEVCKELQSCRNFTLFYDDDSNFPAFLNIVKIKFLNP